MILLLAHSIHLHAENRPVGIVIEEFQIGNPESGPLLTPREITRRICRDLVSGNTVATAFSDESFPDRFAAEHLAYRLSGSVWWVEDSSGGARLKLDLKLISARTGVAVKVFQDQELSLPEASRVVGDALANPYAEVVIASNRDGADVWLNGERVGVTPCKGLVVPYDRYEVRIRHGQLFEVKGILLADRRDVTYRLDLPGIVVRVFRVANPDAGPAMTETDLTRRLCRELAASAVIPVNLPSDDKSEPPNARYFLTGKITWMPKPGDAGTALALNLQLQGAATRQTVLELNQGGLGLPQAASAILDVFKAPLGRWKIRSNVADTRLSINGTEVGTAPFDTADVFFDRYEVEASHPTKITLKESIVLNRPEQTTNLILEDRPIVVYLDTRPNGAEVYVNGARQGVTPLTLTYAKPNNNLLKIVGAGRMHFRRLSVKPYQTYSATLDLMDGKVFGSQVLARDTKPFLYSDVHIGLGYGYSLLEDVKAREYFPGRHNLLLTLGACVGFLRMELGGFYSFVTKKDHSGEPLPVPILAEDLEPIEVDGIRIMGGQGDISLMLPVGRTLKGKGIYPFAGIGYRFERYFVATVEHDTLSADDQYPYWVGGLSLGGLSLECRRGLIEAEEKWIEAAVTYNGMHVY